MVPARRAGGRARQPEAKAKAASSRAAEARPGGPALAHGNGSWGLQTSVATMRAKPATIGIVEKMFEQWFAEAKAGDKFVYHRGLLAADKLHDPALARLADRLLALANCRVAVLSSCGHLRGEVVGSKDIELLTARQHGETVYMAVKR